MFENSADCAGRREVAPHRRLLLKGLATIPLVLPFTSAGAAGNYQLKFRHTHTDEHLDVVFRDSRGYIGPAIARMNWLLRDFRTNEMISIDPQLFDTLYALSLTCGGKIFEIISAYRSPVTNSMLHKAGGNGVATHSLHMDGRAIDLRMVGVDTAQLRNAAVDVRLGGVGFYPGSDFLHLDTGKVRSWGPRTG